MFTNYQKRFTLTTYGNNSFIGAITGFEQVITNGIPTYYVVEFVSSSRVTEFDQYWNYQKFYNLTHYSWNLKYVNQYFYVSANYYFYKTDINFSLFASFYNPSFTYTSFYYDSSYSLFYVAGDTRGVSIFDTNCNFQ